MSIPRKKGGTAAKVLSTALSAALVVAFTPIVALGETAKEAQVGSTQYDTLKDAVDAANAGDTITLLKDVTTNAGIVLDKANVVFDGGGCTLTGTDIAGAAALHVTGDNVTVKNLYIVGPNSQKGTAEVGGTRIWDSGEFGLKVSGGISASISNITVSHANAGIQVYGSTVTAGGYIDVTGNEWGGIELCKGGALDVSEASLDNDSETSKTPVIWCDGGKGTLTPGQYKSLYYEKVNDAKDHYFLSYHHVGTPADLGTSVSVVTSSGIVKCFSFAVPNDGKDYVLSSRGGIGLNNPEAELYRETVSGLSPEGYSSNDGGDNNFRFYNLENNAKYRVYVNAVNPEAAGTITISLEEYDADELSNYEIAIASEYCYFSGTSIALDSLGAKVVDKKTGKATDKLTLGVEVKEAGGWRPVESKLIESADYMYRLVAKPAVGSSGEYIYKELCVLDAKSLYSYDFEINDLVSVSATSSAEGKLKIIAKRYDETVASIPSSAYKVDSWYKAEKQGWNFVKDGEAIPAPTKAGDYIVKIVGANGYTGSAEIHFEATDKTIAVEPTAATGLAYTGYSQYGLTGGSNYTVASTTGNSAYGTNASSYNTTVVPAANCVWADGSTTPKTISWSIARAKVELPKAVTGLTYTGSSQYGVSAASSVTLGGTYYATNVGSYTATASLPNTTTASNYQWSDGTTSAKTISWSIAKGSLPIGVASVFASAYTNSTYTASYSYAGDGTVLATSSNPAVASVAAIGGTLTCVAKATGSATITISATGTANCLPATATVVLTVTAPAAAPEGSFINADGTFAGGSNGGVPGSASDTQQAAASYKVTTPAGSSTPTVAYLGGAATGSVSIPATVTDQNGVTYRVTSIEPGALKGTSATKVTVGSYVKGIGSSAFSGCAGLTGLTIGKNVSSVGKYVIKGCGKLKTVTVKSSKLTKLGIRNLVKDTKVTTIKCSGVSKQIVAKYAKWAKAYKRGVSVK